MQREQFAGNVSKKALRPAESMRPKPWPIGSGKLAASVRDMRAGDRTVHAAVRDCLERQRDLPSDIRLRLMAA